jgi:hypothetical protein
VAAKSSRNARSELRTGDVRFVDDRENQFEHSHIQDASSELVDEFKPTFAISMIWTILGTLMTVGGFILFAVIYTQIGAGDSAGSGAVETSGSGESFTFTLRLDSMLLLMFLSVGVFIVHEAIHGLAFRFFGGKPIYGAVMISKVLPALYCSAPGYRFSLRQFGIIILSPLVVISIVGVAAMPFVENGLLLVFPLALNFGGAVGDVWMAGMLTRRAAGTMVEDLKDGLRFHKPAASGFSNTGNF